MEDNNRNLIKLKPLVPSKNAENGELYSNLLKDAINNEDVYNVALTGGYGSGKSSVIETFLENNKDVNPIRISLANFNFENTEQKQNYSNPKKWSKVFGLNSDSTNEQIQLEISLLQQFLFQSKSWEKDKSDNVFKNMSFNKKINISITLLLLSCSAFFILWHPVFLIKWFDFYVDSLVYYYISIIVLVTTFFWFTYNLSWGTKKFKTTKVDIKPIALEVSNDSNHISILNNYLFEIVKFFKNEKIKLVILEDIDRLESHDLFQKLREINNILRYNPDTKDLKIKFVYLLKESVFKNEKDKTKFFDLIIPVVPYVDNQNSKNQLLNLIAERVKINDKIREVISTASLSIDEMRTVINISNEFAIYNHITEGKNLVPEKLLAIIIYKNLFPSDFENIHCGISGLQNTFEKRGDLIKERKDRITARKQEIENDFKKYNLTVDDKATKIIIQQLNKEQNELNTELANINVASFSEIFNPNKFIHSDFGISEEEISSNKIKLNFVQAMILRGYIAPDFRHYTSIFHKGFLSVNDRDFIYSIRTNSPLDFDYKIDEVRFIIDELFPDDWKSIAILNFDLFEYCFGREDLKTKLIPVFSQMKKEKEKGFTFIDVFFDVTKYQKVFVSHVFNYLEDFVFMTSTDKSILLNKLLPIAICNLTPNDLLKYNVFNELNNYINHNEAFISLFEKYLFNKMEQKKLTGNLIELKIKLNHLQTTSNIKLFNVFYSTNSYALNINNIETILKQFNKEKSISYTNLMKSNLTPLKEYITDNIDELIENVLIPKYENTNDWKEDKKYVLEWLNNQEIREENKQAIIRSVDSEKLDFSEFNEITHWDELIVNKKIRSTWENLVEYSFNYEGVNEQLLKLVNDIEWLNSLKLFRTTKIDKGKVDEIIRQILRHKMNDQCLKQLLLKYGYYLNLSFIADETRPENLKLIIDINYFQFDINIYNQLKNTHLEDNIHLYYMRKFQNEFLANHQIFSYSKSELIYILSTAGFNQNYIYQILIQNVFTIKELRNEEASKLRKVIEKIGNYNSIRLIEETMKVLPIEEQIPFFNKVFKVDESPDHVNSSQLLWLFKGDLIRIPSALSYNTLALNKENRNFAESLKKIGLIIKYQEDKERKLISFKRTNRPVKRN